MAKTNTETGANTAGSGAKVPARKASPVHARIEEGIFFPMLRAALEDQAIVPGTSVEQAGVEERIAQDRDVEPGGEMCDARVRIRFEFVAHHVEKGQDEMSTRAEATRLDLVALGETPMARKDGLTGLGRASFQGSGNSTRRWRTSRPWAMDRPATRSPECSRPARRARR